MRALVLVMALVLVGAVAAVAEDTTTQPRSPGSDEAGAGLATVAQPVTISTCPAMTVCAPCAIVGDATADAALASCLNLTPQQVGALRCQGLNYSDIAMAQAIATKANVPLNVVVGSWQACRNWDTVAQQYKLSVSDVASGNMIGATNMDAFYTTFYSRYYGVTEADIMSLKQQGMSWNDVSMIASASARTGQPIMTIAQLRNQGMSWSDIAAKYNVSVADLACPAPRTVSTRVVCGAGPPIQQTVMYGRDGRVLMTLEEAKRYYEQGYDWLDVAVAANMQDATSIPAKYWLSRTTQGALWPNMVTRYGVPFEVAFDVSRYPFPQVSVYDAQMEADRLLAIQRYQQQGEKNDVPSMMGPMFHPIATNVP